MDLSRLPIELWPLILRHLELHDLIRCRQVSRLFKQSCKETSVDALSVCAGEDCKIFFRFQPGGSRVNLATFLFFKSNFMFSHHLKSLAFFLTEPVEFDFNLLNDFFRLTKLKIFGHLSSERPIVLNLPNLLELIVMDGKQPNFKLNTPKLNKLFFQDLTNLAIEDPTSIKYVNCQYCDYPTLISFKNLEHMDCFSKLELRGDLLSELPELNELHLSLDTDNYDEEEFEAYWSALKEIIRQRELLSRSDLEVTLRSVRLMNVEQLNESYSSMHSNLNFQLKNYPFLTNRKGVYANFYSGNHYASYNHLIESTGGVVPADFFDKFRIGCVQVTRKVDDANAFLDFLKKIPTLYGLELTNSGFSQSLLERLPDEFPDLIELIIADERPEIDLEFILKFAQLQEFETNLENNTDLVELSVRMINELENFRSFGIESLQIQTDLDKIVQIIDGWESNIEPSKGKILLRGPESGPTGCRLLKIIKSEGEEEEEDEESDEEQDDETEEEQDNKEAEEEQDNKEAE